MATKRKKPIIPGIREGHPDDRQGATFESITSDLKRVLEDAYGAGIALIVYAVKTAGVDLTGASYGGDSYGNCLGDPFVLMGMVPSIKNMVESAVCEDEYDGEED